MTSGEDSRRYPRVKHLYLAAYDIYGALGEVAESSIGRTLDISMGGMRLETTKPLPLLSKVNITLAAGDEMVEVEGEVVHLNKKGTGRIETGVEFVNLSHQAKEHIRIILAANQHQG
ncbi:MAG: PilZ domain-containing protein [Nitrospinae bacterium]|nr:PilZ domain-containing protein [Nitrospinota bacterium]